MKNPFPLRAPPFDANAIQATIERALNSAGLDTASGPMRQVTDTIRRALGSGGGGPGAPAAAETEAPVIDVVARVLDADDAAAAEPKYMPPGQAAVAGSFETHAFSNSAGTRAYKLYVPVRGASTARPMVVMLHGCTQSADDFAAGTRMNRLADEHGLLVVYPEQAAQANASKCWNWFQPGDQVRDAGEPSLIAGIVQQVAQRHAVDPRRIYVAGLSAGAAMAVVLGQTYPDVFAGVGVHSGVPYGSAHDIPSALAAMKGGRSGLPAQKGRAGGTASARRQALQPVPTIVFHGDRDHTVQHSNCAAIIEQARQARRTQADAAASSSRMQAGQASGGRSYTRTVDADASGQVHIEAWTLHGAGHAWSGGDARGSFTDGSGPDASAEMLRFFLALPRAGTA